MLENLPAGLGRALSGIRAGLEKLVFNDPALAEIADEIVVSSPVFADGDPLPVRFTLDGEGVSPPLAWSGVPPKTASVLIIMEDADSPTTRPLVLAIVWALPGADGELPAGALPHSNEPLPADRWMGRNSLLTVGYLPPHPPSGHGTHRYAFEVFALDWCPRHDPEAAPGRGQAEEWLTRHAIAKGMLIGLYERP